ncbi:YlbD family protein [Salipaludibacillus sp. CUR1]|uniref:YlbD family protein n=1 Tax=Salipaludibacillus sp. CUR1 TaxID=2820003 RepID=UPI001E3C8818|nr:YlbD family protein [Salipaludibacillus sp. CUR1]
MSQSLHPDVKKFKTFVRENPHVLRDVKSGDKKLQDLFEEWMLFGEEDEIWSTYKNKEDSEKEKDSDNPEGNSSESEMDVLNMLKKMNLNDIQHHLSQFSTVVGSIQELISQFKQQQNPSPPSGPDNHSPFSFRED